MMPDVCTEQQTHKILDYFHSLSRLGREMNPSTQIGDILASTVSVMVDVFNLRRAALLAANSLDGRLLPVTAQGLSLESVSPIAVPPPVQQTMIAKPYLWTLRSLPGEFANLLAPQGTDKPDRERSGMVPLVTSRQLVGLFLFERSLEFPSLDEHDRDLLSSMCQNLAVYLYNQIVLTQLTLKHREIEELYARIKETYRQAIMAFLIAIDIKDGYTKGHSLRVAEMAAVLAREAGFDEHEIEGMYFAGLLHDIGKILVDREILTKRGSLDLTEYAQMNDHTRLGAQILSHIQFPWENLIYAILHHHDRPAYDEFGPPRSRHHLDQCTKIIGLIDAFDAMTSDRPYRPALNLSECFDELLEGLGAQFDPETTRIFLKVLDRDFGRPPCQRRILTDRLLNGNMARLRQQLGETLRLVEQYMGVITCY